MIRKFSNLKKAQNEDIDIEDLLLDITDVKKKLEEWERIIHEGDKELIGPIYRRMIDVKREVFKWRIRERKND